jgi:hypothetical protein
LVATLVAELHAVRAALVHVGPWCDWVEAAAGTVLAASGRWPGRPPEDDDEALSAALAELLCASAALSAAWQGQPAERPPAPPPPAPEPVETDAQRLAREHHELLERARPWARVDGRPYDATLYTDLVAATRFVLDLPELPMYLPVGLTNDDRTGRRRCPQCRRRHLLRPHRRRSRGTAAGHCRHPRS